MTNELFTELANRLRWQAGLANFDRAFPELEHVADEVAMYLEMLAPHIEALTPILTGELRRRVERRRLDILRSEVDRLTTLICQLRHPAGASLQAEVEADRIAAEEARRV